MYIVLCVVGLLEQSASHPASRGNRIAKQMVGKCYKGGGGGGGTNEINVKFTERELYKSSPAMVD